MRERAHVHDARIQLCVSSLSNDEAAMLKSIADYKPNTVFGRRETGSVDFFAMSSIPRLLDKQIIRLVGEFEQGHPAYAVTPLGHVVAQHVKASLRRYHPDEPKPEGDKKDLGPELTPSTDSRS